MTQFLRLQAEEDQSAWLDNLTKDSLSCDNKVSSTLGSEQSRPNNLRSRRQQLDVTTRTSTIPSESGYLCRVPTGNPSPSLFRT